MMKNNKIKQINTYFWDFLKLPGQIRVLQLPLFNSILLENMNAIVFILSL